MQNGFATSLAAWLMLAGPNKKSIGGTRKSLAGKLSKKKGTKGWCSAAQNNPINSFNATCDLGFKKSEDLDVLFGLYGARDRWCDVMKTLRETPRTNKTFGDGTKSVSQIVAETLNYDESRDFKCGPNATSGCEGTIHCPEIIKDPATQLILTSMINLSHVCIKPDTMVVDH
jgi:hypothetical protein